MPHEEKSSASKHTSVPSVTAAQQRLHPDSSTSSHRKSPYKENNHSHKKEESKKNHLEPSAAVPRHPQPDADSGGNHCSPATESPGPSKTSTTTTCDVECPDDNGMTVCVLTAAFIKTIYQFLNFIYHIFFIGPKARLMLRYPDGQREQISLSSKAKLMVRTLYKIYFKGIVQINTEKVGNTFHYFVSKEIQIMSVIVWC